VSAEPDIARGVWLLFSIFYQRQGHDAPPIGTRPSPSNPEQLK